MNDHTTIPIILCVVLGIGVIAGILFGAKFEKSNTDALKEAAVQRNYAEWKVDNPKTGTTIFSWK